MTKWTSRSNFFTWIYFISDYLMSVLAWAILYFCRWQLTMHREGYQSFSEFRSVDHRFWWKGFLFIPLFSVLILAIAGSYRDSLYVRSRLWELIHTLIDSFFIALGIYFLSLLKDYPDYSYAVMVFLLLWLWLFVCISAGRIVILQRVKKSLVVGKVVFRTLIAGEGKKALQVAQDINKYLSSSGYKCIGYVEPDTLKTSPIETLPCLGTLNNLHTIVRENHIDQVIFALEKTENKLLSSAIMQLGDTDVVMHRIPDELDFIAGNVRTANVMSTPLVAVTSQVMPSWQLNIKRVLDVLLALLGILLTFPLMLYVALRTRLSSPGPIIYRQQRVGLCGRVFTIYKFRSMYLNAEKNGPMLSSDNDPRITPWGRVMRKWRLDELPQLWNIVRGDMSWVGPRPERRYYIDLLSDELPYYRYLLRVKPGLTSWGMVKFGYASSLADMKERLKYDLLYMENASLLVDMKILVHTLRILFLGKGK